MITQPKKNEQRGATNSNPKGEDERWVHCARSCLSITSRGKGSNYVALMDVRIKSSFKGGVCMKTGPRSKDVTSANTLRPRLVLYIYLSACYTYLWLLNDDVVECPILTGMQRTKMIIFILHPTQQILNRLACSGRIKATNCVLESSLSINAQSLRCSIIIYIEFVVRLLNLSSGYDDCLR